MREKPGAATPLRFSYRLSPGLKIRAITTAETTAVVMPACCGRQTTSEDTQPALLRHRLFNALGQRVAKARQGHRGPGSAPICQWLIQTHGTEEHAGDHIARQNTGGGQPGAVD